jgi:hypothetical protein
MKKLLLTASLLIGISFSTLAMETPSFNQEQSKILFSQKWFSFQDKPYSTQLVYVLNEDQEEKLELYLHEETLEVVPNMEGAYDICVKGEKKMLLQLTPVRTFNKLEVLHLAQGWLNGSGVTMPLVVKKGKQVYALNMTDGLKEYHTAITDSESTFLFEEKSGKYSLVINGEIKQQDITLAEADNLEIDEEGYVKEDYKCKFNSSYSLVGGYQQNGEPLLSFTNPSQNETQREIPKDIKKMKTKDILDIAFGKKKSKEMQQKYNNNKEEINDFWKKIQKVKLEDLLNQDFLDETKEKANKLFE